MKPINCKLMFPRLKDTRSKVLFRLTHMQTLSFELDANIGIELAPFALCDNSMLDA